MGWTPRGSPCSPRSNLEHGRPDTPENPGFGAAASLSCRFVTDVVASEAPAFSVVADVAIVKGETPAKDRTWLSFPDGTARYEAVHVVHDLPHLVVESVFGLDKGLWGALAAGGFAPASRAISRRNGRLRLVTTVPSENTGTSENTGPFDDLATGNWPGHQTAKAAVNAVVNRWGDGPDTPAGVRARLRKSGPDTAALAGRLTDEQLRVAAAGVRRLCKDWAALPVGGTLRATWPLHDSWLRLL